MLEFGQELRRVERSRRWFLGRESGSGRLCAASGDPRKREDDQGRPFVPQTSPRCFAGQRRPTPRARQAQNWQRHVSPDRECLWARGITPANLTRVALDGTGEWRLIWAFGDTSLFARAHDPRVRIASDGAGTHILDPRLARVGWAPWRC